MNHFTHKQQIGQGIFITFSLLASLADAADLSTEKLRASSSVSDAAIAAQPKAAIQNSIASPVATEAQTKKAIIQPALTQPAITPGAAQSLNPQPLPPGGGLIKPMPGSSIDMAKPRIDTGIKASPALSQPAVGIGGKTSALGQATKSGILLGMDDRAIIIVSGKQTTAGDLKREVKADLARLAGPPKTVKGGARKLDFAQPTPQNTMQHSPGGGKKSSLSAKSENLVSLPGKDTSRLKADAQHVSISEMRCPNNGKGPPKISEVQGKLIPGKRVTIWGECFGDRTGRVEIIGQFSGGKLNPAFVSWDQNSIELEIPANIRGAADHAVALTVVTADDKTSAAMQAQFVAARERIEVPASQWAPNGAVDITDVTNSGGNIFSGFTAVGIGGGLKAKFNLRLNPQCALDNLEVSTTAGRVSSVSGFENGPPNEAAIDVNFSPTCTTKTFNYVVGSDSTTWCHIAYQLHTWAYCPAGL